MRLHCARHIRDKYLATVKGAPETLRSMFSSLPTDYDSNYIALSRRGARVLALGHRDLGTLSHQQLKEMKRDDLEQGLTFAGFVIISCPLKPDSKAVIKEFVSSSHQVAMITGDNPLTACHVARQLRFCRTSTTIILTEVSGTWCWQSVDQTVSYPLAGPDHYKSSSLMNGPDTLSKSEWKQFITSTDMCLTGEGLAFLLVNHNALAKRLLPHVKVFARVNPKQKEVVITTLRALGLHHSHVWRWN